MQPGPGQNLPGNQFMPFGQFYDPNMLCWMQPPFLPMNTGKALFIIPRSLSNANVC